MSSGDESRGAEAKVADRVRGLHGETSQRAADAEEAPPIEREVRRPESVLVVIYTAARDCLLLERVQPAGFLQSVTGSLHWGESPADAAAREVMEETRLDASRLRDGQVQRTFTIFPEWRHQYAAGVEENIEHLWYLELPERQPVTIDPLEHRAFCWVPIEEAIVSVGSWTNREALKRLRR